MFFYSRKFYSKISIREIRVSKYFEIFFGEILFKIDQDLARKVSKQGIFNKETRRAFCYNEGWVSNSRQS